MELIAYTDGSCQPTNPGPMGIGVSLCSRETGEEIEAISQSIGHGTNNVAEYLAVHHAVLRAIALGATSLEVRSDSQLVVNQLSEKWACNDPRLNGLRQQILNGAKPLPKVRWTWIPREQNTRADELSKPTTPSPYAEAITPAMIEQVLADGDRRAPGLTAPVINFLRRADWSFNSFQKLKVGRDLYSTLTDAELEMIARVRHGDGAVETMSAEMLKWSPKKKKDALRWSARGLPPALALRRQRAIDDANAHFRR